MSLYVGLTLNLPFTQSPPFNKATKHGSCGAELYCYLACPQVTDGGITFREN